MRTIEDIKEEIIELEEQIETLENCENIEEYRDYIDEISSDVEIMGISFVASRVLEELDPIAFNCGHSDYNDSELTEKNNELDELNEELEELEFDYEGEANSNYQKEALK